MAPLMRRRLLRITGALSIMTFTGCSELSDNTPPTTQTAQYERLDQISIYTGDDVGIRLPDGVSRVEEPANANLIVLHGDPAVDAEQAVTWLTDEHAIGLLGDDAQLTWTEWTQSEAYRDAFKASGRSEAEPAPHLLVAAAIGTRTTTHRYSWGDQPSNDEILRALDEAMAEIETQTPRQESS